MRKVLFICNQNRHRSRTAEELFRGEFETKSAGFYAGKLLTEELLEWAEIVVVMEDLQRSEIAKRFPRTYLRKQIVSLEVPDVYQYGQLELIKQLKQKMAALA